MPTFTARASKLFLSGIAVVLLFQLLVGLPIAVVVNALQSMKIKPPLGIALDAYQASRSCPFAPGNGLAGMLILISQAFLATGAEVESGGGRYRFGVYRNPLVGLPGYQNPLENDHLSLDPNLLRPGGEVYEELELRREVALSEWTTIGTHEGEHGVGFLLITPTQWQSWSRGKVLNPYRPKDAFLVMACHLRELESSGKLSLEEALTAVGKEMQQIWVGLANGLEEVANQARLAQLSGLSERLSLAGRVIEEGVALASQSNQNYEASLIAFLSPFVGLDGGAALSWPSEPQPIDLSVKVPVLLPAQLRAPIVSLPGFGNPFPDRSQCTWFAYQAYAAFDHQILEGVRGDAGDWMAEAGRSGLRNRVLLPGVAGFRPVPGAVIVLARSKGLPYGHVAIVREVATDQKGNLWMLLWDANWDLHGSRMQHWEQWSSWQNRTAGFLLPPTHL